MMTHLLNLEIIGRGDLLSKILFSEYQESLYISYFMLEIQRLDMALHLTLGIIKADFVLLLNSFMYYDTGKSVDTHWQSRLSFLYFSIMFKSLWTINQVIVECVLACNLT